jgi:ribonuclease P protein subunit POP4
MPRSADDLAAGLARGELIGRRARVAVTNDPTLLGREGTVVDETRETLTLEDGSSSFDVAKRGQRFAFTVDDHVVLLDGSDIAHRPEDRTKKVRVDR